MNRPGLLPGIAIALCCAMLPMPVYAQRGQGEQVGIARQGLHPQMETIDGRVESINHVRNPNAPGRGMGGVHLVLETEQGRRMEVHLGPAWALGNITDRLSPGDQVRATVFQTPKLAPDQYIASSLEFDGQTYQLRDQNLRPFWAGRGRAGRGPAGPPWATPRAQQRQEKQIDKLEKQVDRLEKQVKALREQVKDIRQSQ